MLTFLILLILAWSFYIGYSRGLVLQVYYLLVTLVAALIASNGYKGLAQTLSLWVPYSSPTQGAQNHFFANSQLFQLDNVFYAGLAYFVIFAIVYLLGRVLGIFMHLIPQPEGLETRSYQVAAGVIAVLITLFVLQMGLTILSAMSLDAIQNRLYGSGLVRMIVLHTPVTSSLLHHLWVTVIIG